MKKLWLALVLTVWLGPFVFSWGTWAVGIDLYGFWEKLGTFGWIWFYISWLPFFPIIWIASRVANCNWLLDLVIGIYVILWVTFLWKWGNKLIKKYEK